MNLFRLVLCLSGLMIYFIIRQTFQPSSAIDSPQASGSKPAPASELTVPVQSRPETVPHVEALKPVQKVMGVKK